MRFANSGMITLNYCFFYCSQIGDEGGPDAKPHPTGHPLHPKPGYLWPSLTLNREPDILRVPTSTYVQIAPVAVLRIRITFIRILLVTLIRIRILAPK